MSTLLRFVVLCTSSSSSVISFRSKTRPFAKTSSGHTSEEKESVCLPCMRDVGWGVGSKFDVIYHMLRHFSRRDPPVPIDGVGLQMHCDVGACLYMIVL